ncbi:nuclear transport factor 2 family protein [Alloalcanivorax gelatiniphagus]|uniref:Nuclear transport factor 2 family protein n=1 Tax=Alloalcanivorax gelatiniphagus TaxID=1194167 RepID=A0ABY2XPR7_9GAMM|nr:nuclear transport factor 2 family protein [Alloalcanivorax gelatiniphagus]TMW14646.1 nuclear transport factor 2 family protein [Alloalcanivorax gelatiniphagus]
MARSDTVKRYLRAMEAGDLATVMGCFEQDGTVMSPVYGEVPVGPFYETLFADTVEARVGLRELYFSEDGDGIAAHIDYIWERQDGSRMHVDMVDLFRFRPDSERIGHLSIVFKPS